MKKILSLCIALVTILSSFSVLAQQLPVGFNYEKQSYVAIAGNAGTENAG